MTKHYAEQQAKPDFAELEKRVLKFWEEDKTFEKSVHNRDGAAEFVFYDGPPFANGTPHYGHIMVSYVKDVVARFQTMSGKKVEIPESEIENICLDLTKAVELGDTNSMVLEAFKKYCNK